MIVKPIQLLAILLLFLSSCKEDEKPKSEYYYVTNMPNGLHQMIDSVPMPYIDTSGMSRVYVSKDIFTERKVVKLISDSEIDGSGLYYYVQGIGIIYSKSVTWKTYMRLHSTNRLADSTINSYIDFILTDPNLLIAGEESFVFNGQKYGTAVVRKQ